MANKPYPAGRILVSFFIGTAIAFGLVALAGTWKPVLGLDLQGGTRITLTAEGDPSSERLNEARFIIDQRVNASGVAETDVTTQGGQFVVVEIPGEQRRDLIETVQRQAQLRFRMVACSEFSPCNTGAAPGQPQLPDAAPSGQGQGDQDRGKRGQGSQGSGDQGSGDANRAPVDYGDRLTEEPTADPEKPGKSGSAEPTDAPSETAAPEDEGPAIDQDFTLPVEEALAFARQPAPQAVQAYQQYTCSPDGTLKNPDGTNAEAGPNSPVTVPFEDDPSKPLVTCSAPEEGTGDQPDEPAVKYLLSAAVIQGTDLEEASAGIPQGEVGWVVTLEIGGQGKDAFTKISRETVGTEEQFAIVLDGKVLSAPTMDGLITDGRAQISGNFTETTATSLATSLKFGALPVAFGEDPTIETIGPSLAGDQLSAGLWAGGVGFGLVMIYCLLYYRGLGIVVLGSFAVAAALTYAAVLLLSETAGFTLTLPGIAGFIIAVGATADSFILYFERIRDEMREGKSMRVAVYTGWKRAKVTRLAANTVSLLSAAILFIFATGAVKGFGFALGLSTIIDLAVLFWFTRPAVTYLSRFKFFNGGGKLSGLSPETLGIDAAPATGRA